MTLRNPNRPARPKRPRDPNRPIVTRPFKDKAIKNLEYPGVYCDGDGLYLQVRPAKGGGVTKCWIFRYKDALGVKHDMGLGKFPKVTLKEARDDARFLQGQLRKNIDPMRERVKFVEGLKEMVRTAVTFEKAATDYWNSHRSTWKTEKTANEWFNKIKTHVFPVIGELQARQVETLHILRVLEPIWESSPDTASKVRQQLEKILDYCKGRGYRTGDNPASWAGNLDVLLPKSTRLKKRKSQPSLPFKEVAAFASDLHRSSTIGNLALEFLILTACRTTEVLGAKWEEFDTNEAVWTIPALRMKMGKEHFVPLSARSLEILAEMEKIKVGDYVFPGEENGMLSNAVMLATVKRMHDKKKALDGKGWADPKLENRRIVPHGFRATFKTWAGDRSRFDRETIEFALAHRIKDAAEAVYHRGTQLEKRRPLMDSWAKWVATEYSPEGDKVIPLKVAQ